MRAMNAGVGLIEALIAMLVLSIGILGVAPVFVHSLRGSRSAILRTQAVNLAADMADRIRANPGGCAAYDLAGYGAGGPAEHGCASDAAAGSGNNCNSAQLAEDDLARWQSAVESALPAALAGTSAAVVQYVAGVPDHYRISVAWQEPGEPLPFAYQTEIFAQRAL
jgi:type IV pilus assembly protein PilV